MKLTGILKQKGVMLVFFLTAFSMIFHVVPAFGQILMNQGPSLGEEYPAAAGLSDMDPRILAARIIRVAMSMLGIVFVGLVLYGGFLWMTAGGNDEQVGKAKKFFASGIIGLAIILSAYAITYFVTSNLIAATTGGE